MLGCCGAPSPNSPPIAQFQRAPRRTRKEEQLLDDDARLSQPFEEPESLSGLPVWKAVGLIASRARLRLDPHGSKRTRIGLTAHGVGEEQEDARDRRCSPLITVDEPGEPLRKDALRALGVRTVPSAGGEDDPHRTQAPWEREEGTGVTAVDASRSRAALWTRGFSAAGHRLNDHTAVNLLELDGADEGEVGEDARGAHTPDSRLDGQ